MNVANARNIAKAACKCYTWCYIRMGCYNSKLSAIGWPWGVTNEWVVIIKGALLFSAHGIMTESSYMLFSLHSQIS